jgi:sigma-E factor negative regulatory protein RseC
MLETRAMIVQLQGRNALVEAKGGGGCGNCDSENGCGSNKLSKAFCSKPRQFIVRNEAEAEVGEEVQVTLQNGALLRGAVLMYVLPVSLLLSGAMLGAHWAGADLNRDLYAAIGAMTGLVVGFLLAKILARQQNVIAVAHKVSQS